MSAVYLICLEGSIGVGKSSAIECLLQRRREQPYSLEVIPEPLCSYTNFLNNYNPLKLASDDPSNFATAQMHITRAVNSLFLDNIRHFRTKYSGSNSPTAKKPLIILMERSPFSSVVFTMRAFDDGLISSFVKDFLCHEAYFAAMSSLYQVGIDIRGVLLLDLPPDIALERIKARGRDFEQGLSKLALANLQKQYRQHMDWWRLNPSVTTQIASIKGDMSVGLVAKVITDFIKDILEEDNISLH